MRIRKTVLALFLLAAVLVSSVSVSALFDGARDPGLVRIVDDADLLTDSEENLLLTAMSSAAERYRSDFLIMTVDSDVGDIEPYAEDFYDKSGYGYNGNDGALLIVSMYTREYLISSAGYAESALNAAAQQKITDDIGGYFSSGDWYGGFSAFVSESEEMLRLAEAGTPYGGNNGGGNGNGGSGTTRTHRIRVIPILFCIGISCLIAAIIVSSNKRAMKTAVLQRTANNYLAANSLALTTQRDIFVTSVVTKTPKAPPSSSGGGSGRSGGSSSGRSWSSGSSSVHHSSSGVSNTSTRGRV